MVLDRSVLRRFDRTIRKMGTTMKVVHKYRINLQNCALVVSRLDHITNRKRAGIAPVLEISGIQRVLPNFIEDLPGSGPLGKNGSSVRGVCAPDIFVLVVFLAALNYSVSGNVLHRLQHVTL